MRGRLLDIPHVVETHLHNMYGELLVHCQGSVDRGMIGGQPEAHDVPFGSISSQEPAQDEIESLLEHLPGRLAL